MEPKIKNFQQVELFIQNKGTKPLADKRADDWHTFIREHSEIAHYDANAFFAWGETNHIANNRLQELWLGKEVIDAYADLREHHNAQQREADATKTSTPSIPVELAGLPLLAMIFLEKPRILEEDNDYQKLVKQKKEEWLKNNPGKDTTSKEWIDYRYGSLDNPDAPMLYADAEKAFREDEKNAKKLEKYDKERDKRKKAIYKNLDEDPAIATQRLRIENHAQALIDHEQKQNPQLTKEEKEKIAERVATHHWERFVEENPEKAQAYAQKHEGIKAAVANITEQKKQTVVVEKTTLQEDGSRDIGKFGESLGLEVIPESDWLPKSSQQILQQQSAPAPLPIPQQSPRPSQTVQRPQSQGLSTKFVNAGNRVFSRARGANQARSALGKQAGNALSKLGSQALKQIGLRIALYVGGPLLLIFLFTMIIAFFPFGGATTGEASPIETGQPNNNTGTNSLDYTISFRDTNVTPIPLDQIKSKILARWPHAHLQDWQTIINKSIQNKWNPAFVLALWIEESGAQGETKYDDALGCDPKHPTTDLDRSLTCLFNSFPIEKYPNTNFADFMCVYGGDGFHRAPCVFEKENPHFPPEIKKWYSQLVPSGSGALTTIQPSPSSGQIVPVGQGGQRIASAAEQVAGQLTAPNSTTATYCMASPSDSFHCWKPANVAKMTDFNQDGIPTYVQCTEFVWAAFAAAGYEDQIKLVKNQDAYKWIDGVRNSAEAQKYFTIIPPENASQLREGDIISAGGGIGPDGQRWGHVAIVIKVDGNNVVVAQASTSSPIETWFIKGGRLVSSFASTAREPIQGFLRLK